MSLSLKLVKYFYFSWEHKNGYHLKINSWRSFIIVREKSDEKFSVMSCTAVKIAGGWDAQEAELPHQVSMYSKGRRSHFCGASIIHPFLVLCAAHCFEKDKPPSIQVKAGKRRISWMPGGNTEQVRDVTTVFVHRKYNKTTWDNDIAIVVLNQSLELNEHVQPIRLRNPSWELPGANFNFKYQLFSRFYWMVTGL